jgi:hypothetical protein
MSTTRPTAPLLHRFLGIGITMLGAVFLFLRTTGVEPISASDDLASVIGYGLSGVAVVLLAVAFLLLKPRVPEQGPRQSVDEFWSAPDVIQKVFLVWFLMEGAAVIAAVAFFLGGSPVSALAMVLAIVVFWLNGPATFARS